MNMVLDYEKDIHQLVARQTAINAKIKDLEISMLKDPANRACILDFVKGNFLYALSFINSIENGMSLGKIDYNDDDINYSEAFISELFDEYSVDSLNELFIMEQISSVCNCAIVINNHVIQLHECAIRFEDEFNYWNEYVILSKFEFMAEIFKEMIVQDTEEIYSAFLQTEKSY